MDAATVDVQLHFSQIRDLMMQGYKGRGRETSGEWICADRDVGGSQSTRIFLCDLNGQHGDAGWKGGRVEG